MKFTNFLLLAAAFAAGTISDAFAQTYPSPTYNDVIVRGAVQAGPSNDLSFETNSVTRITVDGSGNVTFSAAVPAIQANTRLNVSNSITGAPGTQYVANSDFVGTDTADCGTSFCINSSFQHSFGGAAAKGGRAASYSLLNQTAVTSATNTNRNFVADVQKVQTATGEGGTGLTAATAKGAYFGIGPECSLLAGAVNVLNCTAAEFDVDVATGASVVYKSIAQFATKPEDRVAGSIVDTMLWLYDQPNVSSPNHKHGILFGAPDTTVQWPFNNTSTMIGAGNGGGTVDALNGVDFSAVTFAGSAFKSNGFSVDQTGSIQGTNATVAGTAPALIYSDNSAGTDLKRFRAIVASGNYFLQHQTDNAATSTNAYQLSATANGPQSHTWFTSTVAGSATTRMALDASSLTVNNQVRTPSAVSIGTAPTSSGSCVVSSFVGGATAGRFTAAAGCAAASTITLNFAVSATNGWSCSVQNQTQATVANARPNQSASAASSASFHTIAAPGVGDVFVYSCQGY